MITLSVITVTRNDYVGLLGTLESLKKLNSKLKAVTEIIVVDGSDGAASFDLEPMFATVGIKHTYIREPDRSLYDAMNKGVNAADGVLVWMLNGGDIATNAINTDEFYGCIMQIALTNGVGLFKSIDYKGVISIPNIQKSYFIHQAVIYSKKSHAILGSYVDWRDFTASDFLFMHHLFRNNAFPKHTFELCIASCDTPGLSSKLNHFICRDFVLGLENKESVAKLIFRFSRTTLLIFFKRFFKKCLPTVIINKIKVWNV